MSDSDGALPDRRSFLVGSAVTLAAGSLLAVDACSGPAEDPSARLADFVALSGALIGVDPRRLADQTTVKTQIFAAAQKQDDGLLTKLLQAYRTHASESPAAVATAISTGAGEEIGFFAKSVMLAWLLGSWYDPASLAKAAAPGSLAQPDGAVISADAYREAWAWKIGQTKAMGTTNAGFGYWVSPPPPLAAFTRGPG